MTDRANTGCLQKGFSLLEVLVAFSVLALVLGVLLQSFSTSLRGVALSERYTKAVMLAESRLAEVGFLWPLETAEFGDETEDGYEWQVAITPYVEEESDFLMDEFNPFLVQIRVTWPEGDSYREVALSSLRLGEKQ